MLGAKVLLFSETPKYLRRFLLWTHSYYLFKGFNISIISTSLYTCSTASAAVCCAVGRQESNARAAIRRKRSLVCFISFFYLKTLSSFLVSDFPRKSAAIILPCGSIRRLAGMVLIPYMAQRRDFRPCSSES